MIPILYEENEVAFTSNGLGRLRDCISATVVEERNSIYELDFEYPVTGANYELIQIGRIVGVTHDDSGNIQPFDIVSFTKPIDGIVTFHCTHISYRQSYMTVTGTNINSLSAAFTLLGTAEPSNPFSYQTDKTSTGYLAGADGIPHSVRQMLGGMEGSILDAYGGEYEWDKWNVILHSQRGQSRDFSIRYGVNMLEYNDELDTSEAYSSCVPYYANGDNIVVGNRVDSGSLTPTGRGECVPLDLTDKFEDPPTTVQLESAAAAYMTSNQTSIPSQTITVSFVRLQDLGYSEFENLYRCNLCDTINVIFPDYGTSGNFKIVKTVYNVLADRYDEMELGALSVTLSEALGISVSADRASNSFQNLSVTNDLSVGGDLTVTGTVTASNIGTIYNASKSVNVTADVDTYATGAAITLPIGKYVVRAQASFPSNSTEAIRRVQIYNNTSSTSLTTVSEWDRYWVSHDCTRICNVITNNTVLQCRVSAGVVMSSVSTLIEAIRIV